MTSNWADTMMHVLDKLVKVVYINVLWALFTLLGGVVFGVMPATATMNHLIRRLMRNEDVENVLRTYFSEFKRTFVSANLIGLIFGVVGLFLYLDFNFLIRVNHPAATALLVGVSAISIVYVGMLLHLFPLFSRFELSIKQAITLTFVMTVTKPLTTILMVVWLGIVGVLSAEFTVMIALLLVAMIAIGLNWLSMVRIEKDDHLLTHAS